LERETEYSNTYRGVANIGGCFHSKKKHSFPWMSIPVETQGLERNYLCQISRESI
jgi:hypothetical protein